MSEFFTINFFIQLITACFGTLGFAVIFKVRIRHLPYAVICGILVYAFYYTTGFFGDSLFLASFAASAAATVFAECCARARRAPALIFLVPGTIPIVPGGDLYYTMRYLLFGEFDKCFSYLARALLIGVGIAGGIVTVSVITNIILGKKKTIKMK